MVTQTSVILSASVSLVMNASQIVMEEKCARMVSSQELLFETNLCMIRIRMHRRQKERGGTVMFTLYYKTLHKHEKCRNRFGPESTGTESYCRRYSLLFRLDRFSDSV